MSGRRAALVLLGGLGTGCGQDYRVEQKEEEAVPVQQPDPADGDDHGGAPDWASCTSGYLGHYHNWTSDHPAIIGEEWEEPPFDVHLLDWWTPQSQVSEQFDPSLDLGGNWWPVDEDLEDDPAYFSARWTAWIRVSEAAPVRFTFGASTDLWLLVDDTVEHRFHTEGELDGEEGEVELAPGQYELELRFAHRGGDSGLRFRILSEHVQLCYPEFE